MGCWLSLSLDFLLASDYLSPLDSNTSSFHETPSHPPGQLSTMIQLLRLLNCVSNWTVPIYPSMDWSLLSSAASACPPCHLTTVLWCDDVQTMIAESLGQHSSASSSSPSSAHKQSCLPLDEVVEVVGRCWQIPYVYFSLEIVPFLTSCGGRFSLRTCWTEHFLHYRQPWST
jgi:hypothetical protein